MVQKLAIMFSYECAFFKIRKRKEKKITDIGTQIKIYTHTHTIGNILI